ncbi:hypothetical protein [Shimwellia blattae]|uniref:Uncharacterized protein n=1 Tax=Shimwellia blattae (strain ATCC 29907 / DSM 4481 / JCM 1650 / NBRC 105725 / CDC 9005-74) TaxID=630626 RepID=I2B5W1_SHIBC|nr:hypothetical protein [Shimwellia blattae]AFJ45915.1 hypothetical protein EBL_c07920 [Shimwellia blattae DSM 4481 = NBRC 105725]
MTTPFASSVVAGRLPYYGQRREPGGLFTGENLRLLAAGGGKRAKKTCASAQAGVTTVIDINSADTTYQYLWDLNSTSGAFVHAM